MKRFLLALMSILIVLSICPAYAQKHANKAEWVADNCIIRIQGMFWWQPIAVTGETG